MRKSKSRKRRYYPAHMGGKRFHATHQQIDTVNNHRTRNWIAVWKFSYFADDLFCKRKYTGYVQRELRRTRGVGPVRRIVGLQTGAEVS